MLEMERAMDKLKILSDRLHGLMADPQPGLFTWREHLSETCLRIADFAGHGMVSTLILGMKAKNASVTQVPKGCSVHYKISEHRTACGYTNGRFASRISEITCPECREAIIGTTPAPVAVPAPAACETQLPCGHAISYRVTQINRDGTLKVFCDKCGEDFTKPTPAPDMANAVTFSKSPAPDSVEAAKRIAEHPDTPFRLYEFVTAYISEQSAQRRAAGELAEQAKQSAIQSSKLTEEKNHWAKLADALAADAQARAGTVNVKRD
jgi:hypothetical protein